MTRRPLGAGGAVITGAHRGIGRATAERLAADGWPVILTDLEVGPLDDVVSGIRETGGTADAVAADITSADDVARLVSEATAALGVVSALVNNAAFLPPDAVTQDTDLLGSPDWIWDGALDVNVRGTAAVTRAFLPSMLETGTGTIVTILSMIGLRPVPGRQLVYSCSKAALTMLTQHVAVTYGARGIRCNGVAPGSILTENQRSTFDAEALAAKLANAPATRLGTPEDVAAAVSFLVSDDAAFVNGQVLTVDGAVTTQLVL